MEEATPYPSFSVSGNGTDNSPQHRMATITSKLPTVKEKKTGVMIVLYQTVIP